MSSQTETDQQLLDRLRRKYSRGARAAAAAPADQTTPDDATTDDKAVKVAVCPMCKGTGVEQTEYNFRVLEVNI